MPAPLLVIAGNYRQFTLYCHEHGLNPRQDARYVRSLQDVRGLGDDIRYTFYGTWSERWRDLQGALDYLEYLERQGRARRVSEDAPHEFEKRFDEQFGN